MSYRLTKRSTTAEGLTWNPFAFLDLKRCTEEALADLNDYVIEDDHGIVDYRIARIRAN